MRDIGKGAAVSFPFSPPQAQNSGSSCNFSALSQYIWGQNSLGGISTLVTKLLQMSIKLIISAAVKSILRVFAYPVRAFYQRHYRYTGLEPRKAKREFRKDQQRQRDDHDQTPRF